MFGAATVAICSTYVLGVTGNARLILYPITQSLAEHLRPNLRRSARSASPKLPSTIGHR